MTHLVFIGPIPYEALHQRPQKLAEGFARAGCRVTYVEPSGIRDYQHAPRTLLVRALLRSLGYHLRALSSFLFSRNRRRGPAPAPSECCSGSGKAGGTLSRATMPVVIPPNRFNSRMLERLAAAVYREFLLREVYCPPPDGEETMTLVEHPLHGEALPEPALTGPVYFDCIDELGLYAGHADVDRFEEYRKRLVERSSAVFVTSRSLEEQLAPIAAGRPLVRIPNGVDAAWFELQASSTRKPAELQAVTGRIVGYMGMLYAWIDYPLLEEAAHRLPETTFVLVGPLLDPDRAAPLQALPNVIFSGQRPYAEVPSYIAAFDLCLIPFAPGKIADTTNPVKVFEYFALGKPVLSTPVAELQTYAREGLLVIAEGEAFIQELSKPRGEEEPGLAGRRKEIAAAQSWQALVARMLGFMGGKEGP